MTARKIWSSAQMLAEAWWLLTWTGKGFGKKHRKFFWCGNFWRRRRKENRPYRWDNILVRSKSGELERSLSLPFETFEKGYWPGREKKAIIGMQQDSIKAFNLEGDELGSYPIERKERSSTTAALHDSAGEEYFGVVVSLLASTHRSEFYVFNAEDSLIFHEAIEATDPTLESFSTEDAGNFILVGGDHGQVWNYKFE